MGWRINLVRNELPIPDAAVAEINAFTFKNGSQFEAKVKDGLLYFNGAHLEWMDYVWQDALQAVLLKHKVNGVIAFSSSEGDNAGQKWSYTFVDGVCTREDGTTGAPTGKAPASLAEANVGDDVAVGFNAYGMTSYERATIGDILPDGAIVVNGVEFREPKWSFFSDNGLGGATYLLKTLNDPVVQLDDA